MAAEEPAVADHRVAVHADQPGRGPHARAVGQVLDEGIAAVLNRVEQLAGHGNGLAIERDPAILGQVQLIVARKQKARHLKGPRLRN